MVDVEFCPVCLRNIKSQHMTYHHFLPKSEGGELEHTMRICKTCHDVLHYYIPLEEVSKYETPELLESHEEYKEYMKWIRNKDHSAMYTVKKVINYMKRDEAA